jgi:hypothetical protein
MSYYYLIEVDPQSPLDMDIQCKISAAVNGEDKRGYQQYWRVSANNFGQAIAKLLINQDLLTINELRKREGRING